jgi:hypothetical protein
MNLKEFKQAFMEPDAPFFISYMLAETGAFTTRLDAEWSTPNTADPKTHRIAFGDK